MPFLGPKALYRKCNCFYTLYMKMLTPIALCLFFCMAFTSNAAAAFDYNAAVQNTYGQYPNYIAIHTVQPAYTIDWRSSRSLLWSYAQNLIHKEFTGRRYAMGHSWFEVSCSSPAAGYRQHLLSSQLEVSMDEFVAKLKEGEGFALFTFTTGGRLQTKEDALKQLAALAPKRKHLNTAVFRISERACAKAMGFYNQYQQSGAYKKYGLGVKPDKFEGGGCASVAAAVAKAGGVQTKQWMRRVSLSMEGFPTQERKVKLQQLFFKNFSFGTDQLTSTITMDFYDLQLIYNWTQKHYLDNALIKKYKIAESPVIEFNLAPYQP